MRRVAGYDDDGFALEERANENDPIAVAGDQVSEHLPAPRYKTLTELGKRPGPSASSTQFAHRELTYRFRALPRFSPPQVDLDRLAD